MVWRQRSRASLLLVELMINVLFFFILLSISLHFFLKTEQMGRTSIDLQFAVVTCENVADIYESGDGSFALLEETYLGSADDESKWQICFDKQQEICLEGEAYYIVTAEEVVGNTLDKHLKQIHIMCSDESGTVLNEIEAYHYSALTPKDAREGKADE